MIARGWDYVDVVFITGDAYIDHQAFATGILSRVLESAGYRVGIVSQPDWKSAEPWREFGRLICSNLALHWLQRHEHGPFSIDAVYRSFDLHIATRLTHQKGLKAVYAYEDAALTYFQAAERLGLRR